MSICQERPVEHLFNQSFGLTATDKASRSLIGPALYPSLLLQSYGVKERLSRNVFIAVDSDFSASLDALEQNETQHRAIQTYLKSLRQDESISETVVNEALRLWKYLRYIFGDRLLTPRASTGPDGKVLLFWRSDPLYLEIEFVPNESWSLFFENMSDPDLFDAWDFDARIGENPSPEALEHISRFILPRPQTRAYAAWLD